MRLPWLAIFVHSQDEQSRSSTSHRQDSRPATRMEGLPDDKSCRVVLVKVMLTSIPIYQLIVMDPPTMGSQGNRQNLPEFPLVGEEGCKGRALLGCLGSGLLTARAWMARYPQPCHARMGLMDEVAVVEKKNRAGLAMVAFSASGHSMPWRCSISQSSQPSGRA